MRQVAEEGTTSQVVEPDSRNGTGKERRRHFGKFLQSIWSAQIQKGLSWHEALLVNSIIVCLLFAISTSALFHGGSDRQGSCQLFFYDLAPRSDWAPLVFSMSQR